MRAFVAIAIALAGLPAAAQETWDISMAPASFLGPCDLCGAGRVGNIGDMDADGTPDLAVSAPLDDTEWPDSGRVFLFSGADSFHRNADLEDADVVIGGGAPSDMVGWMVQGIGDVNGDGFDDMAVGVLLDRVDEGSGTLRLFFGPWDSWGDYVDMEDSDVMFRAEHLYTGLGTSVANAGDIDGDGLDDLWIGAPYTKLDPYDPGAMEVEELKKGRVHLVLGREVWPQMMDLPADAALYITGELEAGLMGSIVVAGDISGDGQPDMCTSSPGAVVSEMEGVGVVHCFTELQDLQPGDNHPSGAHFVLVGIDENARAGTSLALIDFNGDGIQDVVVGAPYSDEEVLAGGSITGYHGGLGLPAGSPEWGSGDMYTRGLEENGCFGYELIGLGDVNGDGFEDILVSAPGADGDYEAEGIVYVYKGRLLTTPWFDTTEAIPVSIRGEFHMDRIGTHLASIGAMDGLVEPYSVFAIGSSHADHAGHEAGKVFLLHFGMTLDDDGDGYSELEGDCRDDDADSHPGADPDPTIDDDCDGWTEGEGDCDDSCANCFPDAPEIADELDNDCDGEVDEEDLPATDTDADDWTVEDGDCDDTDPAVFPGAVELCNGLDDNCNGAVDDVTGGCEGDDDDSAGEDGGCECDAGGSAGAGLLAVALLGVGIGFRRR